MTNNPLSSLKIDYWYKALLVLASCTLLVSLSVEMKGVENCVVQLISLSAIFIGIGEWMNHPLQTRITPGYKITGYPRINTFGGNSFDLVGLLLLIVGIIKIFC
ncbi:hypothetical protein ACFLQL_01380 [Verrucomicrobiota bacterium]